MMQRVLVSAANWPNRRVRPWTNMVMPVTCCPVMGVHPPVPELPRRDAPGQFPGGAPKALHHCGRLLLGLEFGAGSPDVKVLEPHPVGIPPQLECRLPVGWDL